VLPSNDWSLRLCWPAVERLLLLLPLLLLLLAIANDVRVVLPGSEGNLLPSNIFTSSSLSHVCLTASKALSTPTLGELLPVGLRGSAVGGCICTDLLSMANAS
jgi:hypothetical protein